LLVQAHESFNNSTLWALFHYFIDYVNFKRSDWEAYVKYNELFAKEALKHYKKGDVVFCNDFQLLLVPRMLRNLVPDIKVSYFHHITFPASDIFERLPVAKELIDGLLGADYIGFHTKGHVKSFERSVHRVGLELGDTIVETNPISIDPQYWENLLKLPETKKIARWMKSCFSRKKIILATERLDFTKGIKERIQAYDHLLTNHPELRGDVALVQVAVHSRLNVPIYQTIGKEVDEAVGRLNGKYGRLDWNPIYYTNRGFNHQELAALYSISEVGCVTPLIDGLNLVSKEYTISGSDDRSLILSKFAGAADELTEAYIVNPFDTEEVGETMFRALNEPNASKVKPQVLTNTIYDWADKVIDTLLI